MNALGSLVGLAPRGVVLAMPAFLERLDGANLVIGVVTLVAGLLGLAYLVLIFIATPQPRVAAEGDEASPYPSADRFVVPLLLPVGVALAVGLVIFLVSQILLVVPEEVATPIALVLALGVLLVCSVIATARRIPRGLIYAAIGIPAIALVIAGGASGLYRLSQSQAAAARAANTPVVTTTPEQITTDNKFSATTITVPAGQAVTLTQQNNGVAIHNWHVLDVKSDDGKDITTPLTQPGQKSTVTFTITQPGSYKFQCDVHPTEMIGTLKVVAASPSASPTPSSQHLTPQAQQPA